MSEPTKREFRQAKRELKRDGVKHRRRALKRALIENPEESLDLNADFGRFRTAPLNGNDRDATRVRDRDSEGDGPAP